MNRLVVALREVIQADRLLPMQPDYSVVIKETQANATLRRLNISCVGCEHVFAFTLDVRKNGGTVPLSEHTSKSSRSKWNKVCDGIFLWHDSQAKTWRLFLCDLKSSDPQGKDWEEQIQSANCFVDYLFSIVRRFFPDAPKPEPLQIHAVAFHGGTKLSGGRKRRTGMRLGSGYPKSSLESPAMMPVSENEYVHLRALCC